MRKNIICPRCGWHLKMQSEVCNHCGFSFIDAFDRAKDRDIQLVQVHKEFDEAMTKGDKLSAYLCLGKMELLHDPDFRLSCGIVLSRDGEYKLAENQFIIYAHDNIDLSFSDKEKKALPYLLKNYALDGQLTMFMVSLLGSGSVPMDMYQRLYFTQLAYANAPIWDLKNYFEIKDLEDEKGHYHVINKYTKDNAKYHGLFLQRYCRDICKAVDYVKRYQTAIERDSNFRDDEESILNLRRHLQLLTVIPVLDESRNSPVDRIFNATREEVDSEEFNKWVDGVIEALLFDESTNPCAKDSSNFLVYFECLEILKAMSIYCRKVDAYWKKLLLIENCVDEIRHIIGTAYYEKMTRGQEISSDMEKYIQDNLGSVVNEKEAEEDRRLEEILSSKSSTALEVAEWEFSQSKIGIYGWKDAGPLSLSYFRIIELELNQKLVLPLLEKCGVETIQKKYNADMDTLVGKEKKRYEKYWKYNVGCFERIANPKEDIDGMELGALRFLLASIVSFESSKLSNLFMECLYSKTDPSEGILTQAGFEALNNGTIISVVSDENRLKYRNPPAHTRYLPYSVAQECRDFVRNTLLKFGEWFNT